MPTPLAHWSVSSPHSRYCNTYVPLLALFFTLFACTLVSSVCFRDRTRQAAVNCIPMQGDEQILMFPVGRGLLATPVAQRMTTGTLWCVDTYGTCYTPESGGFVLVACCIDKLQWDRLIMMSLCLCCVLPCPQMAGVATI